MVLRGRFTPSSGSAGEIEWCDRVLLARIHRLTLGRMRREIEPVSPVEFMSFLLSWQHVGVNRQLEGRDGVLRVIQQLQGLELPAPAWEQSVLPARVRIRARSVTFSGVRRPLLDGETRSCFSMTEPDAPGSNPYAIQTRAVRENGSHVPARLVETLPAALIDLGTRNDPTIENWRLCSECHHSEREEPGAVPSDESYRLRLDALRDAIAARDAVRAAHWRHYRAISAETKNSPEMIARFHSQRKR